MNDTPPDVAEAVRELYQRCSPDERVRMVGRMFESAKALATAGIRHVTPDISDVDLYVALFDRFYGRDVDAHTRAAVVTRIREGR